MKKILPVLTVFLLACAAFAKGTFEISELPGDWVQGTRPTVWKPGEVTVVEFWATWCGPCVKAMPHMEALWQETKDSKVNIIGVNVADGKKNEQILDFVKKQGVTYAIAVDRTPNLIKKMQAMGVRGIPHAFVVREGKILWHGAPTSLTAEKLEALRTAP